MNPWVLMTDIGIACALLLAAKMLRANVELLQRLFIPTALLAGVFGLVLGRSGLGWINLSEFADAYGGVLICAIFSAVGLSTRLPRGGELIHRTGRLWALSQTVILSQWILGVLFGILLIPTLFPDLPPAFGLLVPEAFVGGHGTVAGVNDTMVAMGWEDFLSLGYTAATVGVFLAVLGGMAIINVFVRLGFLTNVQRFEDMDVEIRRGLTPANKRSTIGDETVSSSSVHVFTLHLALIGVVTFAGHQFVELVTGFYPSLAIPVFACCFIIGCLTRHIMDRTGLYQHFDDRIVGATASSATDFLIFFGVTSIKLSVLVSNTVPLLILLALGIALCIFCTLVLAPMMLKEDWAPKAVFTWGWATATVGLSVLLLRVCDPKGKSHVLDDFAIAYLPCSIGDILLLSLVPTLVMAGQGGPVLAVLCACQAVVLLLYVFVIRGSSPQPAGEKAD
jgi:ESS family glutamate:Na+ symporter